MSMSNPKVKEKQCCITVLNLPNPSLSCSCVGCRALCNAGARRPITKQRVKAKIRSIDLIIVFSCVFFVCLLLCCFRSKRHAMKRLFFWSNGKNMAGIVASSSEKSSIKEQACQKKEDASVEDEDTVLLYAIYT